MGVFLLSVGLCRLFLLHTGFKSFLEGYWLLRAFLYGKLSNHWTDPHFEGVYASGSGFSILLSAYLMGEAASDGVLIQIIGVILMASGFQVLPVEKDFIQPIGVSLSVFVHPFGR